GDETAGTKECGDRVVTPASARVPRFNRTDGGCREISLVTSMKGAANIAAIEAGHARLPVAKHQVSRASHLIVMNSHDGRDPAFPGKRKNRRCQAAVDIVEMDDVRALFVQNACKGIRRTAAMDSFARGTQSPIVPVACALTLSANS